MAETILPNPRFEMPSLFYPKRKPVGNVKIDWSHPLAQGLEHLYIATNKGMFNLVENRYISNPHSALSRGINPGGICRDFNGVNLDYDVIAERDRVIGTFGFVGAVDFISDDKRFLALASTSSFTPLQAIAVNSGGGLRTFWRDDANTGVTLFSSSSLTQGELVAASMVSGEGIQRNKLNHLGEDSVAVGTGGGCITTTFAFGGIKRASESSHLDCTINLAWIYDRALTPIQLSTLHSNPYQFLIPQ